MDMEAKILAYIKFLNRDYSKYLIKDQQPPFSCVFFLDDLQVKSSFSYTIEALTDNYEIVTHINFSKPELVFPYLFVGSDFALFYKGILATGFVLKIENSSYAPTWSTRLYSKICKRKIQKKLAGVRANQALKLTE